MQDLDGKKIKIMDLFTRDIFFKVPDYQRPYTWNDDQFYDLIDDIFEAEKDQDYFLGTIVLHKKENTHEIVDGQQRLTTLMILFACLRDRIEDKDFKASIQEKIMQKGNVVDGIEERVRIEVKDREIFNKIVVNDNGTKEKIDITTLPEPQWRYVRAVQVFTERLSKLSQTELNNLVQFISQKCLLIFLATTTFDDAFKLFTIVNDRGKQLRRIDILKAKNIAPDIINSETVRNSISQRWEQWEKTLGEAQFEDILYLIRLIFLGDKPKFDLLVEYEDRIFKKNLIKKGEEFIDTVCKYSELYDDIFEDYNYFDNHLDKNKIIGLLWIMKNEFKASEWIACILSYVLKFQGERLFEFIKFIELKYLEGWLSGINKDKRVPIYGRILSDIRKAKNVDLFFKNLDQTINSERIATIANENIYGKTYCKYLLLRLELQTTENDVEKKFEAKSIEHILPQIPGVNTEWLNWFDEDQRFHWTNKLANLVLLSRGKNSSAKNFDLETKKEKYLNNRVSDYPRSIKVLEYNSWTPDILEKRQREAIQLLQLPIS